MIKNFIFYLLIVPTLAQYNVLFETVKSKWFNEITFSTSLKSNTKNLIANYKNDSVCKENCLNDDSCLGLVHYKWKYYDNNCHTLNHLGIIVKTESTSNITNVIKYIEYNKKGNSDNLIDIVYFKNNTNIYSKKTNNKIKIYNNISDITFDNKSYINFHSNCSIIFYFKNKIINHKGDDIFIDSMDSKAQANIYYSNDNIKYNFLGVLNNEKKNFNIPENITFIKYLKFDFFSRNQMLLFRKYIPLKNIYYDNFLTKFNHTTFSNYISTTKTKTIISSTKTTTVKTDNNKIIDLLEDNILYLFLGIIVFLLILLIIIIRNNNKTIKKGLKRNNLNTERLEKEIKRRKLDSRVIHNDTYAPNLNDIMSREYDNDYNSVNSTLNNNINDNYYNNIDDISNHSDDDRYNRYSDINTVNSHYVNIASINNESIT